MALGKTKLVDVDFGTVAMEQRGPSMSQAKTRPSRVVAEEDLADLLSRTARGDRDAFNDIYRCVSAKLLGIAFRMIGTRDLAEEVLQETFLTIWQKADQFDESLGSPSAWLCTIVRHRSIDRIRAIGAVPETPVGTSIEIDELLRSQSSNDTRDIVVEQALLRCLSKLKKRQQQLILFAFYHGFTHDELAQRFSIPLGTVKSDVRRGLADLAVCMGRTL